MKTIKQQKINVLLFLCLSLIGLKGHAQLSTSFYTNESNSKIAFGYEFNEKLWGDLRIYSNFSIADITPEIVLNYNYLLKDNYETYVGAGLVLNNLNGIVIPVGIAIKPFEQLKNVSLNIEFNPVYEFDFNDLFIQGFIGIRYKLD